ncbi:hypothetical protein DL93DRAFT_1453461 [Clavulina sp. PMI_390]|nr:hypothetical protein DL93DRAFT_1453461 [Clavulina sp. PMI_390]
MLFMSPATRRKRQAVPKSENTLLLASIVSRGVNAVPVPAGPILPLAGLALRIVEVSEGVKAARTTCRSLAMKCSRLAAGIIRETQDGLPISERMLVRIAGAIQILEDVVNAMNRLVSRKISWVDRLWRLKEIEMEIKHHELAVDEAIAVFLTGAVLDIHKETNVLIAAALAVPRNGEPEIEEIRRADIAFEEQIASTPTAALHRGTLQRNGLRVVVKEYYPNAQQLFLRDLRRLNQMMHPNLPMVVGRSVPSERLPYFVVTHRSDANLKAFLRDLLQKPPTESFLAC